MRILQKSQVRPLLELLRSELGEWDYGLLIKLLSMLDPRTHDVDLIQAQDVLFPDSKTQREQLSSLSDKLYARSHAIDTNLSLQVLGQDSPEPRLSFLGLPRRRAHAETRDLAGAVNALGGRALIEQWAESPSEGRVLIVTCNENETRAVRHVFGQPAAPRAATAAYALLPNAGNYNIFHLISGQGPTNAALAVPRAIEALQPSVVVALGMAFGCKPDRHRLGDVVVARHVVDYDPERVGQTHSVPRGGRMVASGEWLARVSQAAAFHGESLRWPTVHFGLMLSGSKLVDNEELRNALVEKTGGEAIAGDMEAAAVAQACSEALCHWLVIKGIADWANAKPAGDDKRKIQYEASHRAASVLRATLAPDDPIAAPVAQARKNLRRLPSPITPDYDKYKHELAENQAQRVSLKVFGGDSDKSGPAVVGRNAFEYLMEWALSPFDDAHTKEPNFVRTVAPGRRYFALLGEYGMGKTVLCQRLTKALEARHEEGQPAPVPLYFDLRRLTNLKAQETGSDGKVRLIDRVPTIEEVVEECIARGWRNEIDEPKHTLRDVRGWLDEGALVIFDGLDEVLVHFTDTNGQQFVNQLLRLLPEKKKTGTPSAPGRPPVLEAPSPPVLMLVTCRTHFFRSVRDQYAMLTERGRGDLDDTQFETLVLLPFAEEQIVEYLQKAIPGIDVDHLLTTLRSVHNLGEIATRPYLLSLISQHLEQIERWRAEKRPVYGVTLYREFVNSWLTRDKSKHQLQPVDKIALAKTLAVELWRRGQRLIGIDRLNAWFAEWRKSQVGPGQDYLNDIDIEKLEEDLRNSNFLVREDARGSRGIDESASGFRFAHTSLQEYFLAEYLFDAVRDAAPERWALPTPSVETLNFLGQLLNESSDCERWTETISQWRTNYRAGTSEALLQFACVALDRGWAPPVLAGIDLAGANLRGFELRAKDEASLNLASATFRGADLRDARLANCRLDRAVFADALLDRAEFDHCSMRSTLFSGARLLGTRLHHADLRGARWADVIRRAVDCVGSQVDDSASVRSDEMFVAPAHGPFPDRNTALLSHVSTQPGPLPEYGLSGDGQLLLSMSLGKVQLTDMERLVVVAEAVSSQDELVAYAFSPDGALLATASRTGSLCVWDARTLQLISSLAGHGGETLACGFSPDNRQLVAFEWPGAIQIRDTETLAAVAALPMPDIDCRSCRYSRDGLEIELVDGRGKIHYFKSRSLQTMGTLTLDPAQKIVTCRYSPDGSYWLGIDDSHCIWVRDAKTFKSVAELQHSGKIAAAEFSSDGARIVSASESGALQLWDIATGKPTPSPTRTHSPRFVASLPRTNQLFCAGSGSRFELHDLTASGVVTPRQASENAGISSCAFSPDGAFIICGDETGAICVWRYSDLQPIKMLDRHRAQITACAVSSAADVVATADASGAFALGPLGREAFQPLEIRNHIVVFCAFSPSGRRMLSVTDRRAAIVWDVPTGSVITQRSSVITGEFVSDDELFLLSGKMQPRVWNFSYGKIWKPSTAQSIAYTQFSEVGNLLLHCGNMQQDSSTNVAPDDALALMRPRKPQGGYSSYDRAPRAMTRDGKLILSGHTDGILRVWNAHTCEEEAAMLCARTSIAAWSSRKNRLVCAYGDAWRRLGWLAPDEAGAMRRWPLETFGDECLPLPPQLRA